ncbi:MAG: hypothetical protein Fur006_49230 [Coleofasciculaceae cyanobacterium]
MVPEKTPCQIEKTPARITSETFVNAVSTVYLRCNGDFDQFCSLLNLKADKYGQEKWRLFNELIERINSFDMPTLTRIIEMGSSALGEPVPGKSESD